MKSKCNNCGELIFNTMLYIYNKKFLCGACLVQAYKAETNK